MSVCRELIWGTHKQAGSGADWVTRCLQLWWYWPGMIRDAQLRVRKCELCQASKHGRSTKTAGRHRLYSGLVASSCRRSGGPMPMSEIGNNWILVLTDHFT